MLSYLITMFAIYTRAMFCALVVGPVRRELNMHTQCVQGEDTSILGAVPLYWHKQCVC